MITYNDIYEALRRERYSEQLQKLPNNFITEVAAYFVEKKEIVSKQDDMFSDMIIKTKKQLENAVSIFKELLLRRRKKLLTLVFVAAETGISKRDFENMLNFEKEMFESIMKVFEGGEKELNAMMNGSQKESANKLIMLKEDVVELMGLQGEKLGPFNKGDIANLQKEIADILILEKKAEEISEE